MNADPKLSVETATQLAVFLANSSGRTCAGVWPAGQRRNQYRLADAKVNIEYTYLAAGREAEKGLIILRPSDVEKARRALEEL